MTREEFEKHVSEETGLQGVAMSISREELIKIGVFLKKADKIVCAVGESATKQHDMELIADCLMAGEAIEMVMKKFIYPIMEKAMPDKPEDGKEEETDD